MKLSHFLVIGLLFAGVAMFAFPLFASPLAAATETIRFAQAEVFAAVALVAGAALILTQLLLALRQSTQVDLSPLDRFSAPQTGTPQATAYG